MLGTIHIIICSSMLTLVGSLWYFLGGYDTYFHTEWSHIKLNFLQYLAAYTLYGIGFYPVFYLIRYFHLKKDMIDKPHSTLFDILAVEYKITEITYEDEKTKYVEMISLDIRELIFISILIIFLWPISLCIIAYELIEEHKRDFKLRFNKKYRIKTALKD